MSQCPFRNILDPDIYAGGHHHAIFAKIREQSGGLAYIEDPITGVPYWAVIKRDIADYICKNPLLFSSQAKTILPKEMPEDPGENASPGSPAPAAPWHRGREGSREGWRSAR